MSGSASPQGLLQCWTHPVRDLHTALSSTLGVTWKPVPVFSRPPPAKLLTEPTQASTSPSTVKGPKHMTNLVCQSFHLLTVLEYSSGTQRPGTCNNLAPPDTAHLSLFLASQPSAEAVLPCFLYQSHIMSYVLVPVEPGKLPAQFWVRLSHS